MYNQQVAKWLEKMGLRPEQLAAMSNVSYSTLSNGLRGARWSERTAEKIKSAIKQYEADQSTKKAS
jgi:predicted transcriptional regulator